MPFTITDVLFGFAVPFLVAAIASVILPRLLPHNVAGRTSATIAFVAGFEVGYWLLSLGPHTPASHWHWLPYVMLLPVIAAPILHAEMSSYSRIVLCSVVAAVAAWVLVPEWEDLQPSRKTHIVVWTVYAVLLAMLTEPLIRRFSGIRLAAVLAMVLISGSIVLALSGSLRFAQILGAGVGAFTGLTIASKWVDHEHPLSGIALSFYLLLCGGLLVGQVNSFSDVPLFCYLLVPAAPLSLWLTVTGPVSRWTGAKKLAAEVGLPLALCLIAIIGGVAAD